VSKFDFHTFLDLRWRLAWLLTTLPTDGDTSAPTVVSKDGGRNGSSRGGTDLNICSIHTERIVRLGWKCAQNRYHPPTSLGWLEPAEQFGRWLLVVGAFEAAVAWFEAVLVPFDRTAVSGTVSTRLLAECCFLQSLSFYRAANVMGGGGVASGARACAAASASGRGVGGGKTVLAGDLGVKAVLAMQECLQLNPAHRGAKIRIKRMLQP
jgi:hypothetical protein